MIWQLFSILKDAIYRRILNIVPEGKNLHQKRKWGITKDYKSADENEKKVWSTYMYTRTQKWSIRINISFFFYFIPDETIYWFYFFFFLQLVI